MSTVQHVAIIGCGIGGLTSALALSRLGIQATVFERDPAPPDDVAPADSMQWLRKGVPQSRHPHFFMGKLRGLIDGDYPDLARRLRLAGVGENHLADYIDPARAHVFQPSPLDGELRSFNSRRTTFEMIVREYISELDGVNIRDDSSVTGLETETTGTGCLSVTGVEVKTGSDTRTVRADVVIDASGRSSRLGELLKNRGARIADDQCDSRLWYFTRHYRLKPGQAYPLAAGLPGAQFDDYIVGALPADNGTFTITFQIFREDGAFARAIRDPEHFQRICAAVNDIAAWVDPERSEPTSDVYGFGRMDSFWRHTVINGEPGVLNFFCVGDSGLRSNPKYGRGCTWTALAAHELARLLALELSPGERIRRYEAFLEAAFLPDWRTLREMDRMAERHFQVSTGRVRSTLADRALMSFQHAFTRALSSEPSLFRDVWAGYHGITSMQDWRRNPRNWLRLLRALAVKPRRNNGTLTGGGGPPRNLLIQGG